MYGNEADTTCFCFNRQWQHLRKETKIGGKRKRAGKPKRSEAKATTKTVRQRAKRKCVPESSSNEEENFGVVYDDSSSFEDESDIYVGCGKNYKQTKKKDDWIQCTTCSPWMHEVRGHLSLLQEKSKEVGSFRLCT